MPKPGKTVPPPPKRIPGGEAPKTKTTTAYGSGANPQNLQKPKGAPQIAEEVNRWRASIFELFSLDWLNDLPSQCTSLAAIGIRMSKADRDEIWCIIRDLKNEEH